MECYTHETHLDLQSVCRICLEKDSKSTHLFSDQIESTEILNKINMCFQIYLKSEKHLPHTICRNCILELNKAYNFRVKCITTEERLKLYCEQLSDNSCKQIINADIKSENSQSGYTDNTAQFSDLNMIDKDLYTKITLEKQDTFKCNICNKVLKTMASLLKHKISMHEKRKHVGKVIGFGSVRRYHCNTCTYSTPHSQTLVNHMRRHDGERPYNCECGKSFTQASSLAAHRKTHSTTMFFTCAFCGNQFKHAFALKNHLSVHEIGRYRCNICQKTLKSKQSLRAHTNRHYNICNYNCEDCGDTFVTSAELLNHRKKHSTEKKIECHLCGYRTHTKKNLINHLNRHAGNKAFKCDICHVAFYTRCDLKRHRRVHTREKPFSCPMCAQRFTHSSSLNKHMKNVHAIDYKWGDIKWKETRKLKDAIKTNESIPVVTTVTP